MDVCQDQDELAHDDLHDVVKEPDKMEQKVEQHTMAVNALAP